MYKLSSKKINELYCCGCDMVHRSTDFYKSYSPHFKIREKMPFCKQYLIDYIGKDKERMVEMCRLMDVPFIAILWDDLIVKEEPNLVTGYFSSMGIRYRDLTFKDSQFGVGKDESDVVYKAEDLDRINELSKKWGSGYDSDVLEMFENKYKMLSSAYEEVTNMHTEALMRYIRFQVMSERAIAENNPSQAKDWANLARDSAKQAKIDPNQLSQADLQGGLSNVGEIVKAVEREADIIELLPKFRNDMQDGVDFTIWCYVNYCRKLQGLDEVEYKDIYNYVDLRIKEYAEEDNKVSDWGVRSDSKEE